MSQRLRRVKSDTVVTGWDFSTGAVKCLAFDLDGNVLAEVRMPTDLWRGDPPVEGLYELNLMQLEGQARASVRAIASRLRELDRLDDWAAGGISATHHTSGRIDADQVQVRRAICWNDATLADYQRVGLERLGGQDKVRQLIGGPWAIRYSLSHLVKDEACLAPADWKRTARILGHGALAAGYLTGNYDVCSVSVAASTGIMDLRKRKWTKAMLDALENPDYRKLAWKQLPKIIGDTEPVGPLAENVAMEAGVRRKKRPLVFPTSDDQQAGLVGGGAVDAGQVAVILGNSAVVNSSSDEQPSADNLDVMRLNWGPYLWMRCYNNGAQFLDEVVGRNPDWKALEAEARSLPPGSEGTTVMPFTRPEPSLGVDASKTGLRWTNVDGATPGRKFRASLEALAALIALGVRAHEAAGQKITRITVSGGIARSDLMCEILASTLNRPLERLESDEGPALGAAVTALAALETHLRKLKGIDEPFTVADAVAKLVRFKTPIEPNPQWIAPYAAGLRQFEERLASLAGERGA